MDEKEANIDLVFRNGLKDYEVLPPAEVWNNVRPVIKKKQKSYMVLRAAATIALIMSLSYLTYQWSEQYPTAVEKKPVSVIAANEFTPASGSQMSFALPESIPSTRIIPVSWRLTGEEEAVNDESEENTDRKLDYVAYTPLLNNVSGNKGENEKLNLMSFGTGSETGFSDLSVDRNQFFPQVKEPGVKVADRWSVAALISPTYYTRFSSGKNSAAASHLMSNEQELISYSGGVAFSYKINKRFSFQSGLYYSAFGQEISDISSFGGFRQYDYTKGDHNFEVQTINGVVFTSNADIFLLDNVSDERISSNYTREVFDPSKAELKYLDNSLRQNFSYLELPVILKYKVLDKTVDFNIIGGLSSNVLVGNSVYAASEGTKYQVGKTEGLNMITFSSSLGMGMEYSFTDKLSLNLEPTFRYYISPFNEIPGLSAHPYSFGIFSGLSYKF